MKIPSKPPIKPEVPTKVIRITDVKKKRLENKSSKSDPKDSP